MAVPLACATVLGTTGRRDVSVPSGTTVAGLMAMLRIDLTDGVVLTRSDGVPADPGSVIGADLPSGVVLSVNDSRESSPSAQRSAARQSRDAWFRPVLVLTVLLSLLGLAEVLTVVMPLRGVRQPGCAWGRPRSRRAGSWRSCAPRGPGGPPGSSWS